MNSWIASRLLHGKTGLPARLSLAEACEAEVRKLPLVLIGGILPPGGSEGGVMGATSSVLQVRSLPLPASSLQSV